MLLSTPRRDASRDWCPRAKVQGYPTAAPRVQHSKPTCRPRPPLCNQHRGYASLTTHHRDLPCHPGALRCHVALESSCGSGLLNWVGLSLPASFSWSHSETFWPGLHNAPEKQTANRLFRILASLPGLVTSMKLYGKGKGHLGTFSTIIK